MSRKKIVKIKIPFGPKILMNLFTTFIIFFVLISLYSALVEGDKEKTPVSISDIAVSVQAGEVSEIVVKGNNIEALLLDGTTVEATKESGASLTDTLVNYGVKLGEVEGLSIKVEDDSSFWLVALNIGGFLLPLLFIVFFLWFMTRQAKGQGMQAFTFGQSRAKIIDPNDKGKKITFDDVAGAKEAKEELKEIVDFLRHPKKFLDIGAQIPKGVILMGAPGTGKTLLARATSGEAGVPFYSISGSEFVEMFVGVGASVTGDTPILVRDNKGTRLVKVSDVVDQHYSKKEADIIKRVDGLQTLGFRTLNSGFRGEKKAKKMFFGGSQWSNVEGVYRHKVDEIYKVSYFGGEIRTTGNH